MSVLLLRLAGPLQSWGAASRFARRETEREPTKSGVLGLLASAQGRRRSDSIEDLMRLRFGVRIDQPGSIVQDFHTAHHPDGRSMPLTRRFYLSDAVFVAGVEGPLDVMGALDSAIREPAFPLYLGRRSCPPAGRVSLGVKEGDLDLVLRGVEWQASAWHRRRLGARRVMLRLVRDAVQGEDGITQRDVPLSFDPVRREYGWRTVVECDPVEVHNPEGQDDYHDPIAELGG